MEEICIFDDCIDKDIIDDLEKNLLYNHSTNWIYHSETIPEHLVENNIIKYSISENLTKNIKDVPFFVHPIVGGDQINDTYLGPICARLITQFVDRTNFPIKDIIRLKANLTLPSNNVSDEQYNNIHIDEDREHYALIVYLNESDGDTIFFNNKEIIKEVSPKKGRIVVFDGSILHANKTPKEYKNRLVLNIDMTKVKNNGN